MGILEAIKKMLGLDKDYDAFDVDIIIDINSALMVLNQLGVGQIGFKITGYDETWEDFAGDTTDLEGIKTFVYLKTKLLFDPPNNSFVISAIEKQLDELSWRMREIAAEGGQNG